MGNDNLDVTKEGHKQKQVQAWQKQISQEKEITQKETER